ncbi:MAG: tetratricopeptide repeat protein [Bryobacterales bacterium]
MAQKYVCLICYNEIPHAGAECPHCKSRISSTVGSTPQMLVAIFVTMILLFIVTGFYNSSFRAEQRERAAEHARMARTLADYGYHRQAIEHYREALTYARDNVEYQLGLALALYDMERYSEAENRLLDLRADHPTLALVNRLLARIAARDGRVDEAVSYYRTAIFGEWRRDPAGNRLATRFELAELLRAHGENMRAVGELLDLRKEAPARPDVQKTIGRLLLEAGAPDNAAQVFEELLSRNAKDREVIVGYAQAQFALGNYVTAQTHFERALALDGDDPEVRSRLALSQEINRLDPTRRGISSRNRYRRSLEMAARSTELLQECLNPLGDKLVGPPVPPPKELQPLLAQARELRSGKAQPPSDENIEANISLAERLWQAAESRCPGAGNQDRALRLVVENLSR